MGAIVRRIFVLALSGLAVGCAPAISDISDSSLIVQHDEFTDDAAIDAEAARG